MKNMNTLSAIPRIKRLADRFGTPMIDVTFIGEGVVFKYKVGDTDMSYTYADTPKGIESEIERWNNLLAIIDTP